MESFSVKMLVFQIFFGPGVGGMMVLACISEHS